MNNLELARRLVAMAGELVSLAAQSLGSDGDSSEGIAAIAAALSPAPAAQAAPKVQRLIAAAPTLPAPAPAAQAATRRGRKSLSTHVDNLTEALRASVQLNARHAAGEIVSSLEEIVAPFKGAYYNLPEGGRLKIWEAFTTSLPSEEREVVNFLAEHL